MSHFYTWIWTTINISESQITLKDKLTWRPPKKGENYIVLVWDNSYRHDAMIIVYNTHLRTGNITLTFNLMPHNVLQESLSLILNNSRMNGHNQIQRLKHVQCHIFRPHPHILNTTQTHNQQMKTIHNNIIHYKILYNKNQ